MSRGGGGAGGSGGAGGGGGCGGGVSGGGDVDGGENANSRETVCVQSVRISIRERCHQLSGRGTRGERHAGSEREKREREAEN